MNSTFFAAVALVAGLLGGAVLARWRSRADILVLQRNIDLHLHLFRQQLQMQLEAAEQARRAARYDDAYKQLGGWLHELERTIDEVWFGCTSDNPEVRYRARTLVDQWPWETLRVPAEVSFAAFSWSSSVREAIRDFAGTSGSFVMRAKAAMEPRAEDDGLTLESPQARVWEARSELLSAIDRIRGRVRADLAGGQSRDR